MNKLKLLTASLATLLLVGCEESIPSDRRYTQTELPDAKRAVLVEEYTGVKCVNCPQGHRVLEDIEEVINTDRNLELGVGVIVVGIHIPNWGQDAEKGGLIAPEAYTIAPQSVSPPQATINRCSGILNRDQWAKHIIDEIYIEPDVKFSPSILAELNGTSIKITGRVESSQNFPDATLHVWIVEDNIVKTQNLSDGSRDKNYVHKNVFRACVNGVNGKDFPLQRNSAREFSYSFALNPDWKAENLRVVAFVETDAEGVLNASQNHLIINN